jgi:hypothetical protein
MFKKETEPTSIAKLAEYVASTTAFLYLLGFIVWYFYLSMLGFSQFDVVQIRYILTGLLVVFSLLTISLPILMFAQITVWICRVIIFLSHFLPNNLIISLKDLRSKIRTKFKKTIDFFSLFKVAPSIRYMWDALGYIFLCALFLIIFTLMAFPLIPSQFGGGQPKVIAFIGDENTLQWFGDFGIPIINKQTDNLCVVYENTDVVILALKDRVLELEKKLFVGKSSIPSQQIETGKVLCGGLARSYLYPQLRFSQQATK